MIAPEENKTWEHPNELINKILENKCYPATVGILDAFLSSIFIELFVRHPEAFKSVVEIKKRYLERRVEE